MKSRALLVSKGQKADLNKGGLIGTRSTRTSALKGFQSFWSRSWSAGLFAGWSARSRCSTLPSDTKLLIWWFWGSQEACPMLLSHVQGSSHVCFRLGSLLKHGSPVLKSAHALRRQQRLFAPVRTLDSHYGGGQIDKMLSTTMDAEFTVNLESGVAVQEAVYQIQKTSDGRWSLTCMFGCSIHTWSAPAQAD